MSDYPIFELPIGRGVGAISPIPGRSGAYMRDVSALLGWAPDLVISMIGLPEMERVGAESLGSDLLAADVAWRHVPVTDFGTPNANTMLIWLDVEAQALNILNDGGLVLAHCHGGRGRSGMAILRLMVALGEEPIEALSRLRTVRPCAVETDAQFTWASGGGS